MAQFQQLFDAHSVDPSSFVVPPLADYHVVIVESDIVPTNDKTGGMLVLQLEILDPGPYKGKRIPYRLNLYNQNQQAVEMANRQLSAVCHVTNVFSLQDSRQLHGIAFIANIGPQANNPQYSNVFFVKDLNGNIPGKAPASQGAPQPPQAPPTQQWGPPPPPQAAPAQPPAPAWGPPPPAPAPTAASPVWPGVPPPPYNPGGTTAATQPPPPQPPQPAWGPPAGGPPANPPWVR